MIKTWHLALLTLKATKCKQDVTLHAEATESRVAEIANILSDMPSDEQERYFTVVQYNTLLSTSLGLQPYLRQKGKDYVFNDIIIGLSAEL